MPRTAIVRCLSLCLFGACRRPDDRTRNRAEFAGSADLEYQAAGLTVHGSNNGFPNDSQVTQAIGQMFNRCGLRVNAIELLPYAVYAPGATQRKYIRFLFSFGGAGTSSLQGLSGVLTTYNAGTGSGAINRARYSKPEFDAAMRDATAEFDTPTRNAKLAEAARIAMEDAGILPLYWQKLFWASRKVFVLRPDRGEIPSARFVSVAR